NPKCGSTDANSLYDDGHTFCFACDTYGHSDGEVKSAPKEALKSRGLITDGYPGALIKRKIHEATCRKFGYHLGEFKGKPVQIAPFYNKDGEMVAQKLRFPDKTFTVLGSLKNALPFGANLWNSGRKIVVTEGEID